MGTQRAISDHDTKILSLLREQRTQGLFTDVKIVSADTVFWAHACVLAPFSSLISKIFYSKSEGSEKKWSTQCPCTLTFPDNNVAGNNLSRFCEECIQKVIDFIYCGQIKVDRNHAEHVQFVVKFLEIENLPVHGSLLNEEILMNEGTFHSHNLQNDSRNKRKFSPVSSSERSTLNSKPGKAVRLNFENILSENNSLCSKSEVVPKTSAEVLGKINSSSSDELIKRDGIVAVSSPLQNPAKVEEFSTNSVNKVKTAKKRKSIANLLCLHCPFEGSSPFELINHKLEATHEEDVKCFLCNSNHSSNGDLLTHLKKHLEKPAASSSDQNEKSSVFKCEICNKEFGWRHNFLRHLDSHMLPDKKCSSCDFVTNTDQALKYHIRKMHSDFSFACNHENCSFKTKRKGNLKNHILSVHKKTRLCCSNCDKTFSQKKNLQRHMNLYHNTLSTIHHCSLCTYVTHRADNLQKHKLSMHNIKGMQGWDLQTEERAPEKPLSPVTLSVISPQTRNEQFSQNPIDVSFCLSTSIADGSNGSGTPLTLNVVSSQNRDEQSFTQKPLDMNFCLSTSISGSSNFSPVVSVSCSDFTVKNPSFSSPQLSLGLQGCIPAYTQNGSNFSLISTESKNQNKSVSQMISLPDIDCNNTGTLSFNETAGTLTYHNLNSDSTGALILNETTGELTYIKLVPQTPQMPVHEYPNFPCSEYTLPCTNYSLTNDTVILNESTGELDSIKQQEMLEFDRALGRYDEDAVLFDPAEEEEEENELLDFDPADFMNESNSNPEIPVLNEWTGEINLLPNNFLGGPFLDEQTGQLSVFDLFDNDAIFDCLEEPPLPNVILNENTGEILRNNKTETATDYRPNEILAEASDCAVFCEDLTLDNDCEYSLNEATGQLSIAWPDVSEDSNISFLLNELTGELSVKGVNG